MQTKKLSKSWEQIIFIFSYVFVNYLFAWCWEISQEVGLSGLKPENARANQGKMVTLCVYQQKAKTNI